MSPVMADTVEKVFSGRRNFLAPLVRPKRGDVRDHMDSRKSDHWPPHPC